MTFSRLNLLRCVLTACVFEFDCHCITVGAELENVTDMTCQLG